MSLGILKRFREKNVKIFFRDFNSGANIQRILQVSDDRESILNGPINCRVTSIVVSRGKIILWSSTQHSNEGKEECKGLHDACSRIQDSIKRMNLESPYLVFIAKMKAQDVRLVQMVTVCSWMNIVTIINLRLGMTRPKGESTIPDRILLGGLQ